MGFNSGFKGLKYFTVLFKLFQKWTSGKQSYFVRRFTT